MHSLPNTEIIAYVTGRYHWLVEPLLYLYKKYFDVPLTFFSDRPIEGCNAIEVFPRNMRIYQEPCGKLIKDALSRIDKPIVSITLMDMLPISMVDIGKFRILAKYMAEHANVARGNLYAAVDSIAISSRDMLHEGDGFSIRKLSSKQHGQIGATSILPAIWRKDFLLEFIEDAWTFDAIELPGQHKFMAQDKWYSIAMLPGLYKCCHLCYTAHKNLVRLSTIPNMEDRAFVAQFVPEGFRRE